MMENDKDYEQKNLRGINKRVVNHYRQLMGGSTSPTMIREWWRTRFQKMYNMVKTCTKITYVMRQ